MYSLQLEEPVWLQLFLFVKIFACTVFVLQYYSYLNIKLYKNDDRFSIGYRLNKS
jgi:hypothetical protein